MVTRILMLTVLPWMCYTLVPPLPLDQEADILDSLAVSSNDKEPFREKRSIHTPGRLSCEAAGPPPPARVNSTVQLRKLRHFMQSSELQKLGLKAYIITTDDEHQSEYVAPHDNRRKFISGFSGSAGTAVVTLDRAALWIDGRYFLQAEEEVDCNWLLMKEGLPETPSLTAWLRAELKPGDRVGADPRLIAAIKWKLWRDALLWYRADVHLVPVPLNLVDQIWNEKDGRPPASHDAVYVHDIKYAGKSWLDKVHELRADMTWRHVDVLVVTALDEVAWLLNLRGKDIPHSPVFKAYVVVMQQEVRLYILPEKVNNPEIKRHLRSQYCNHLPTSNCVILRSYESIFDDLRSLSKNATLMYVPSRWSYAGGASYAIYSLIPRRKRILGPSPVLLMKARKNPTEIEGMQHAHIRDAVALCDFMAMLEEEVEQGKYWDEITASTALEKYRSQQDCYMGLSFPTISGFGPHSAVVHYHPQPATNKRIDNSSVYLLDSGGQYLDGTTDVTRTFHFGTPSDFQRETYTRVLMGSIDLAALEFTEGTSDAKVDIVARTPLREIGLDYKHGTGHGIGAFLLVHEGPIQIVTYGYGHAFEEGHFLSAEPGYYKENNFGIRLETIIRVLKKNVSNEHGNNLLRFEAVTLVPFEPKLIKKELLSKKQIDWLTNYNLLVRRKVGEEMKRQGRMKGYHWLMARTTSLWNSQKEKARTVKVPVVLNALSTLILLFAAASL